jgi:type II secretory pathway component PulJ
MTSQGNLLLQWRDLPACGKQAGARAVRRGRSGMTLLEVVLAVALTIGLMMSVMAFYRHVIDVREQLTGEFHQAQRVSARRAVMDRLTDELRSAMVFPFLQLGLSGQAMEVQFVTAGVPSAAVWAVTNITEQAPERESDLRIVGYRLRVIEDANGQEVIEGLERTEQKTLAAEVIEEGEQIQSTLIAPQFKFVSFRYWDNQSSEWMTSWGGGAGNLPMAVEIVIGAEPLPQDMAPEDYPYATFRRVVYVPGGSQPNGGGTIIRGLGSTAP